MGQLSFFGDEYIEGEIDLTFFGFATDDHAMDLKWYAQSLMGFNESFVRSNRGLFNIEIQLEIVAEEQGSLKTKLKYAGKVALLALNLYTAFIGIDTYHDHKPSAKIHAVYVQIIDLFKKAKGNADLLEKLVIESDLTDEEKARLLALLKNLDFRLALDDMTLFLEQNGLDKVKIDCGGGVGTVITEYDRPYFKVYPDDFTEVEPISDVLTVVAIGNDKEWKFKGTKTSKKFSATILDNEFLQRMKEEPAGKIFKMTLKADILKTTRIKAGNRKPSRPTYEIKNLWVIPEESLPLLTM